MIAGIWQRKWLLAAGVLAGLSTPGVGPWWLILPALLLFLGAADSSETPFVDGWLFALAYFSTSLYWIAYVVHVFGGLPKLIAWVPLVALAAYSAVYAGLALKTARLLPARWFAVVLPVALVAFDALRGVALTGFPWNPWSASLITPVWPAYPARFIGSHGLSLLLLLFLMFLARALFRREKFEKKVSLTCSGLVALVWMLLAVGAARLPQSTQPAQQIAMVQGNLAQDLKWSPEMRRTTIQIYEDLTRRATAEGALDLIVWPETAMPFFFQAPGEERSWVRQIAKNAGTPVLFGSPAFQFEGSEAVPRLFNRAYALDREGRQIGQYDKMHLVPFGEYVPLENVLFFVKKMVEGIGEFAPGDARNVLEIEALRLGTLICYEVIFPFEVAEFAQKGANLLVQITNDAWFGETAAPRQHLAMAAMRAMEIGLPIVRAANTGISAWIDTRGVVHDALPMGRRGYVLATVTPGQATPFVAVSDILHLLWLSCSGLLLLLLLRERWQRHREKQQQRQSEQS